MPISRLTVLAVCAGLALGCADSGGSGRSVSCTEVGCVDGVELNLAGVGLEDGTMVDYRVCVASSCSEGRKRVRTTETVYIPVDDMPDGGDADVRVTLTDASGRTVADRTGRGFITVTYPNGEDCPPECRSMLLRLEDLRGAAGT